MQYDLYDFDKTVYPADSGVPFLLFCLLRRPWIALLLPYQFFCLFCFTLKWGADDGDKMKARSYAYLRLIDGEKLAAQFWQKHGEKIYPFFLPQNRKRPAVVCSASPEFFLRPICDALKVDVLVATRMNPKTGQIDGRNCKNAEKVRRLAEALPQAEFIDVYSDSLTHDAPIFSLGQRNFHTVKGTIAEIPLQHNAQQKGQTPQ